jgi:hypothetical protein
MPCQDYYEDTRRDRSNREYRDMLARTACAALTALEKIIEDLNLTETDLAFDRALMGLGGLSPEHYRQSIAWWNKHKEADAAEKERRAQIKKEKEEAKQLLALLTPEQRKLLSEHGLLSGKGEKIKNGLGFRKVKEREKKTITVEDASGKTTQVRRKVNR